MNRNVRIAPSILSADLGRLTEEVRAVEAAGADVIHVDVMDGRFVPNLTFGPEAVRVVRRTTKLPVDAHLMIVEPERSLARYVEAGASTVIVHVETCPHLHRTVRQIRELGAEPGVTLNPATPLVTLEEILPEVGRVLVMSVNPGFGGQHYIPEATEKIRRLKGMIDARGLSAEIEVDGGVHPDNAAEVVAAGASILVAGSAVFSTKDYAQAISALRG